MMQYAEKFVYLVELKEDLIKVIGKKCVGKKPTLQGQRELLS